MDKAKRMDLNAWLRQQRVRSLRFGPKEPKPFDARPKLPPQAVPTGPILPQPQMHAYVQGFRSVFRRRDTMRNAEIDLLGLCSDLPRKNGETMEAAIPGAKQMDIFHFLVRSGWAPEALDQARVQQWVAERGHKGQALHVILDESSVLKQGKWSVGAARQDLGCVGKVANGQVMVTLHGVWGDDQDRGKVAGREPLGGRATAERSGQGGRRRRRTLRSRGRAGGAVGSADGRAAGRPADASGGRGDTGTRLERPDGTWRGSGSGAEQDEDGLRVGGVAVPGRDAGPAFPADQADCEVAQAAHSAGSVARAHLAAILIIGEVPYVVQFVLDVPVPADQGEQPFR
jgi:hypothetical protein